MTYSSFTEFRNSILTYLKQEKEYYDKDIEANESLTDAQKIETGLLIDKADISSALPPFYILSVNENNTKLRAGDKVLLVSDVKKTEARIVENLEKTITVESSEKLDSLKSYRIEVHEFALLDPLIQLTRKIEEGAIGSYWMEILANVKNPNAVGYKPIDVNSVKTIPPSLNEEQRQCIKQILDRPTFCCLQGPPGTGKTDVLAVTANTYRSQGYNVLIISNTHQAVNNALNKIYSINRHLSIVKIGDKLKSDNLDNGITCAQTYNEYLTSNSKKKTKDRLNNHDIVGMTLQAAVINLGLRKNKFIPTIVLVDEAGQIPLSQGALLGAFGGNTIVLIGDDLQMPPIFHEKLIDNELSVSVFTYLCNLYPKFKHVLKVTYRMNEEITKMVSDKFYLPHGITLEASVFSAHRTLEIKSTCGDERIDKILNSSQSIHQIDVSNSSLWKDENTEEAEFISSLIKSAISNGVKSKQMAVITPYRKQVKKIRECVSKALSSKDDIPLIDTVERLQGQDVDLIIISLSITDKQYWEQQKQFVMNPNRLNVMLSRAKKKVIIVGRPTSVFLP